MAAPASLAAFFIHGKKSNLSCLDGGIGFSSLPGLAETRAPLAWMPIARLGASALPTCPQRQQQQQQTADQNRLKSPTRLRDEAFKNWGTGGGLIWDQESLFPIPIRRSSGGPLAKLHGRARPARYSPQHRRQEAEPGRRGCWAKHLLAVVGGKPGKVACAVPRRYRPRRRRCSIISPRRREIGGPVALRHPLGPVSLTEGQSQASIFNDLGAWLQCAMEGEMVDQQTAKDRLIDRRSVLRTGAALAPAPRLMAGRQRRLSANSWSVPGACERAKDSRFLVTWRKAHVVVCSTHFGIDIAEPLATQAVLSPAFLRSPLFRLFPRPRPQRIPFPNLVPEISAGTRTSGIFSSTLRRVRLTGRSRPILTIPITAKCQNGGFFAW